MRRARVLIVEDDPAILAVARDVLEKEGFEVDAAESLRLGQDKLLRLPPDLLVLDLNLPDGDGLQFCRRLASSPATRGLPVFITTARGATQDIVEGLEAGAQDYMAKPYNMREFAARVRAMARRSQPKAAGERDLVSGRLRLSPQSHGAWCEGRPVELTLREFEVLRVLMAREGEALRREDIIARAWGPSTAIVVRVIDVHVSHLRSKLGREGRRIETVPQVGFRLARAARQDRP